MVTVNGILIGLGIIIAGVLLVRFTFQIAGMTGPQDWLESITGAGSTYAIYKIFGVLLVILGLLVATGFGNNALSFLLSPFKGVFHPLQ